MIVALALLGFISLVNGAISWPELATKTWTDAQQLDSDIWNPTITSAKQYTTADCGPYNGDCSGDLTQVPIADSNCPATPWTKDQLETFAVPADSVAAAGLTQFMTQTPPAEWTSDFAYHFDAGFISGEYGHWTALGHGFYCPTADPLFWFNSETGSVMWANTGKWAMGKPSEEVWWELIADTTYAGPWREELVVAPTPPELSHSGTWGNEAFFDVTVTTTGPVEMKFSTSSKAVGVSQCSLTVDGTQTITLFRTGIVSPGAVFYSPTSVTLTGSIAGAASVKTTIAVTAQSFGKCSSYGDPHVKTFDGQTSDPRGAGDHTLVSTPNGDFVVQARQAMCGSVACNFGAAVKWRDTIFVSTWEDGEFSNIVDEGVLIERYGPHVIRFSTIDGVEVTMMTGYYYEIYITLPPHYRNHVDGICGNFNGNKADEPYGFDLFSDFAIARGQSLFHMVAPGGSGAGVIPATSFPASHALQCTGHAGWNNFSPPGSITVAQVSPPPAEAPTGGGGGDDSGEDGLVCVHIPKANQVTDQWCMANCIRYGAAWGALEGTFSHHPACTMSTSPAFYHTCQCAMGSLSPPPAPAPVLPDKTPLDPTSPKGQAVIAVCAQVLQNNQAVEKCEAVGVDVQYYYDTCLLDGKYSGVETDAERRSLALVVAQAMAADCVAEGGKAGEDLTVDVYQALVLDQVVLQFTTADVFEEFQHQQVAVPLAVTPILPPKVCNGELYSIDGVTWRKVRGDYTMVQEYSNGWIMRKKLPWNAGQPLPHGDHGNGWTSDEQGVTLNDDTDEHVQKYWTWCCMCA